MTTETTVTMYALGISTVKVPTVRITAESILFVLGYLMLQYTQDTVCHDTYCWSG
jgi:hypothetical protein